MNSKNIFPAFATLLLLLFTSYSSDAQNSSKTQTSSATTTIEMIQFHSENRCKTCMKIEELTKETLKEYSTISFSLVNVDDKKNARKAEQFEATGTALFLYNPTTGRDHSVSKIIIWIG